MSLGGDKFINAPSTGNVVRVNSLDEPYYAHQFAGGRRFDHAEAAGAKNDVQALPAVKRSQLGLG
jgi:hypothetical protein